MTKEGSGKEVVKIYTDGSSRGNPGPGGYGVVLLWGKHRKELSMGYRWTTNNRMEIMGVIAGLEALKGEGLKVMIYSDSSYVVKAIQEKWLEKWIKTNFAGGKKNKDLWLRVFALLKKHQVNFTWVRGHGSNAENNRCDLLATGAADGDQLLEDIGCIQQKDNLEMKTGKGQ
ncbi:MAG: ribonuclease HI [Chitinophagaceae bacterium]